MVSSQISTQVFAKLKKDPENNKCIECDQENPAFVSVNNGCLICGTCIPSHFTLTQEISRIKAIEEQWTLQDLKLVTAGGNSALKEFFDHYGISSTPPNFKYLTKASFFYREMLSVVAFDEPFEKNCPEIQEGVEIVARNCYIPTQREETKTPEPLLEKSEPKKSIPTWDLFSSIYTQTITAGNKAAEKILDTLNELSETSAVKKTEEKTKKITDKIVNGLGDFFGKVSNEPVVQKTVSTLNSAADSIAKEVKCTYTKINSSSSVKKIKEDTMNMIKGIGKSVSSSKEINHYDPCVPPQFQIFQRYESPNSVPSNSVIPK